MILNNNIEPPELDDGVGVTGVGVGAGAGALASTVTFTATEVDTPKSSVAVNEKPKLPALSGAVKLVVKLSVLAKLTAVPEVCSQANVML